MKFFSFRKKRLRESSAEHEIEPDEIFLDSSNLPQFDKYQFEGRLEKAISAKTVTFWGFAFLLCGLILLGRTWVLQIARGESYAELAQKNRLRSSVIFAPRGLIEDRNGEPLAVNKANEEHPHYPSREYVTGGGFSHLLGYIEYPKTDSSGVYFRTEYVGKEGVEYLYNAVLKGENGLQISEENARGDVESESVIQLPRYGLNLTLSVDKRLQQKLYELIKSTASDRGFVGGAAGIMDIETGELLVLTSFPEYDSNIMSEGSDPEAISDFLTDERQVFLNRSVDGLYAPGSIMKPFIAVGALIEGVISPDKQILSTGSISIPNPYNPSSVSVFRDWKAHGLVDMREALAVSSDVYFYEIGGGFEDQQGLGIERIKKYLMLFGFGDRNSDNELLQVSGTIPDPKWKAETFEGEPWRIGDTYNTSIGQYGTQVTLMQVLRATAALTNGGRLIEPTLMVGGNRGRVHEKKLDIPESVLKVVQEGMRDAVLFGTASGLGVGGVEVAAKTGTAEIGSRKLYVNSWIEGFFPYDDPRYAFVVLMERGPHDNTVGALFVMRQFIDWLSIEAPEYLK